MGGLFAVCQCWPPIHSFLLIVCVLIERREKMSQNFFGVSKSLRKLPNSSKFMYICDMTEHHYSFGQFNVDAQRKALLKQGSPVKIGRKCLILLETLLAAEGRAVSKSDLLDAAWNNANVEESNLSVQIAALRKCLGRSPTGEEWIATVQRFGYQFVNPKTNLGPIVASLETEMNRQQGQLNAEADVTQAELALPDKPSIAVLPFTNLSGDPEQEYFADGIVEDMITALSRFNALFVIARNSSFAYKGRAIDVKLVGRELGVRYILEGSVRKSGNKVRISGQLIDTATGAHLWADRFDGMLEDVFDLQDHVTSSVVGAIAPKLEQAEIQRAKRKPTESQDAYDHFLRGMIGIHKWSREGSDEALTHFYKAFTIDPGYAAAYGMAARAYVQRNAGGWMVDRDFEVAETRKTAIKAAELGQDDAIALSAAGLAYCDLRGLIADGDALIDRALSLNPNLASAWLNSCWTKTALGEPELGLERIEKAQRLSPNDPHKSSFQAAKAYALICADRSAEAYVSAKAATRERPGFLLYECIAVASAALSDNAPEAKEILARLLITNPTLRLFNINTILTLHRREDALRWEAGMRLAGLQE
jgi:TolB-like protein